VQILLIVLFAIHALTGVFWAGSTFVMAHIGVEGSERLARAQRGAATLAVFAGVGLWGVLHRGPPGPMEKTLAVGAVCALAAAVLQAWLRKSSPALSQRLAAILLTITVVCMVTARYIG
jgi:hypothetical protein